MKLNYYISTLLLLLLTNFAFSQINKQVNVVKEYTPIVSDAYRISILPKLIDTSKAPKHKFSYNIESQPFNVNFKLKPINSAKMVGEPLTKLYSTNINIGFGNYLTPYFEVNYNSLRSKDKLIVANIKHISSFGKVKMADDNKVYAGFTNTEANLYGKKILSKKNFISGNLAIANKTYGYYGYDATDSISDKKLKKSEIEKQNIKILNTAFKFKSIDLSANKIKYDINIKNTYLQEISKIHSNNLSLFGNINNLYQKEIIGLDYNINYVNTNTKTDTVNNTIVQIKPYINKSTETWRIIAGLNFNTDINSPNDPTYHFYPNIDIEYNVFEKSLIPFIGVTGNIENNNYQKIILENPYIANNLSVKNTNNLLSLYAGLKGRLSSTLSYNFKTKYNVYENMYFYVNQQITQPDTTFPFIATLSNKFDVLYDNVTQVDVYGEINWKKSNKLNFLLFGHYYKYALGNLNYAWHKPNYNITFSTKYNIQNKIITNLDIFAIGKQYAVSKIEYTNAKQIVYTPKELKGFIDVNLSFQYKYTKILSAFIKFNNILSQKYYEYNYYPTQGFNVLIGLSYSL